MLKSIDHEKERIQSAIAEASKAGNNYIVNQLARHERHLDLISVLHNALELAGVKFEIDCRYAKTETKELPTVTTELQTLADWLNMKLQHGRPDCCGEFAYFLFTNNQQGQRITIDTFTADRRL